MSVERILVSIVATSFQSLATTIILFKQIKNINLKSKFIYFIFIWMYGLTCFYIVPNQYRFLIFLVVSSLIMKFLLKINDKKVILYSFNTEVLLSISEILISFFLVMFGINSVDIVNNYVYNFIKAFIFNKNIILIPKN